MVIWEVSGFNGGEGSGVGGGVGVVGVGVVVILEGENGDADAGGWGHLGGLERGERVGGLKREGGMKAMGIKEWEVGFVLGYGDCGDDLLRI